MWRKITRRGTATTETVRTRIITAATETEVNETRIVMERKRIMPRKEIVTREEEEILREETAMSEEVNVMKCRLKAKETCVIHKDHTEIIDITVRTTEKKDIRMKRNNLFIVAVAFLVLVSAFCGGCNRNVFYSDSMRVDENGWNLNDKLDFEVEVKDTTKMYSFFIDVRNSYNYPYSNTFLFITTTFPDGSIAKDTMECPLADVDGRWYGKQTGHYVDNRYRFRNENIIFPMKGTYKFQVSHAMRDTNVVGLKNVGLRIEYAN